MSCLVEVIVNGRMNGGEFLEALHPPETVIMHFTQPSEGRSMSGWYGKRPRLYSALGLLCLEYQA